MRQIFDTKQHEKMEKQVKDARIASFLDRASISAHAVCAAHEQGVVGQTLDLLEARRNHWVKEVRDATEN